MNPTPLLAPIPRRGPGSLDVDELAARYVALWMEPDPDARRRAVAALFRPDGAHLVEPPEEVRAVAAKVGFGDSALELHGVEAMDRRVTTAYDEFVAPGRYAFRPRGKASRLRDVVLLDWEMVEVDGGAHAASGVDVLVLDDEGRIAADYQFLLD